MMRQTSKAGQTRAAAQAGYSYVSMLIVLVGLSLAAQTAWIPQSTASRREAERELLFRGQAYMSAIRSYVAADPIQPAFPKRLEDLLDDPRQPGLRHIRRLYAPVIASEWRVIASSDGGIAGVAPMSQIAPLKRVGFAEDLEAFEEAEKLSDWEFVVGSEA